MASTDLAPLAQYGVLGFLCLLLIGAVRTLVVFIRGVYTRETEARDRLEREKSQMQTVCDDKIKALNTESDAEIRRLNDVIVSLYNQVFTAAASFAHAQENSTQLARDLARGLPPRGPT